MNRPRLGLVFFVLASLACKARHESESTQEPTLSEAGDGVGVRASGHVQIIEAPVFGDVAPMVRDAAAGETARHRKLLVYAGAVWCDPCRRFHAAAMSGELDALLPELTLFEFDLDKDRDRLKAAGYVPQYIPLFALPSADGSSSGKQVEGAIKGDGAVGFLVPKLRALLSE